MMENDDFKEGVGESSWPATANRGASSAGGGGGVGYTDIRKEIFDRLMAKGIEEVVSDPPAFREQLDRHFERLPASYSIDLDVEKAEDVLLHRRILDECADPDKRPVFHVRFLRCMEAPVDLQNEALQGPSSTREYGNSGGSPTSTLREIEFKGSEPCQRVMEDLSLERRKVVDDSGRRDVGILRVHELIFSTISKPMLLAQLSTLLSEDGLNIREAHVFSTTEGFCLDVFVDDGWETEDTDDLLQSLKETVSHNHTLRELIRRHAKQNHHADNQPRPDAAGPSGHAHTIDEERPGQTHKLKLRFNGSLKSRIYTNKSLLRQSQSNGEIEITICSDDQPITSGPHASLRVEIVALESDHSCKCEWTEEDFDRQICKRRHGPGSVLDGCLLKLVNGKTSLPLGNFCFREGSTGTRSKEFVLAARVCRSENTGGVRVEEAFMHPPFMVLVERSSANEKSSLPKLSDKVHLLKGIARHGAYNQRLENKNIFNVQDFLKALNKDPDELRQQIMGMKSMSSWETVVRHARECDLRDSQLKSYKAELENITLFFNCVYDLVGADFHDGFVAKDKFGERQKVLVDNQLKQAYIKLDGIKFDYVMEGNYPVKIDTNITATQDPSVPILLGASTQNTSTYQAAFQAENLSPGCGINHTPDLPLGDANCNAQESSALEPTHQAAESLSPSGRGIYRTPNLPLGEANCSAGELNTSAPSHQGVGQNDIPQGDSIWRDMASADVDIDDIWNLVEEPQQTNNVLDCSPGWITVTPGIPPFSPNAHGSEPINGEPDFELDELDIPGEGRQAPSRRVAGGDLP